MHKNSTWELKCPPLECLVTFQTSSGSGSPNSALIQFSELSESSALASATSEYLKLLAFLPSKYLL